MENHTLLIENREKIQISEVQSLDAFDDEAILVNLKEGGIIIKGENLKVETLDVDGGQLIATGKIESVSYVSHGKKRRLPRLHRK